MFFLAFFGFLRCSEFAPSTSAFNPAIHPSLSDITAHTPDSLIYNLKRSKTDQFGESFPIYIFRLHSFLSPYEPLSEYVSSRYANHSSPQEPLFLTENRKMATRFWFSKHFQSILRTSGISPEHYSIHSFRIGAATTTASMGISDETIRVLGRWSSEAYRLYIRNNLNDLRQAQARIVSSKPLGVFKLHPGGSSSNSAYCLQRRSPHSESPGSDSLISQTEIRHEIFEQISSSNADNLKKSRNILEKIVWRKLPKFVGEARLTEKNKSKEQLTETWKAAVQKYKPTDPTVSLNAEELPVYVVDLDHGMKDKNPIESIYFYSKRNPNQASTIKYYQLSSFLPKKFNEELVRVYYRRTDDQTAEDKMEEKLLLEEAEKCFQIWCTEHFGLP
ncbi:unnamed protein product [Leuciscus chuanchicus]